MLNSPMTFEVTGVPNKTKNEIYGEVTALKSEVVNLHSEIDQLKSEILSLKSLITSGR